jgi:hypothetical protein
MNARTARVVVWVLVGASILSALLATAWFVVRTIDVRVPYWGEAEVLFEASRLRSHLPLYVDPLVGTSAADYGSGPPSRYYVTYPPGWSCLVSFVPAASAPMFARVLCTGAWFGSLAALARAARAEQRLPAIGVAAFVGGIWVLANFATVGRPDSIAIAIATVALVRAMRKGALDPLGVALLVLVPWVKPTIIGLPLGALAGMVLVDRKRGFRMIALAAVLAGVSGAIAHVMSNGQLFVHVIRSNAQPFTLAAWLEQVPSRLPFFGPLFAWAAWCGYREREDPATRVLLGALAGSVLWTLIALAKTGSSSNYWMEPCLAAVALVARAGRVGGLSDGLIALVAVVWTDTASIRAALEHTEFERAAAAFVASVRQRCGVASEARDAVIAADEAGIELVANGRILIPTYQMVHLVRRGSFPAALWDEDLRSPHTQCFVEHTGQLRLAPELQSALEASYAPLPPDANHKDFRLWKKK